MSRRLTVLLAFASPLLVPASPAAAKPPPKPEFELTLKLGKREATLLDRVTVEVKLKNKTRGTVEVPPLRLGDDAITIVLREGDKEFRLRRIHGTWSGENLVPERVSKTKLRSGKSISEKLVPLIAIRPGTYEVRAELRGVERIDEKNPPSSRAVKLVVKSPGEGKALRATLRTSYGIMTAELATDAAYNTCHEFIRHSLDRYYGNGMTFYRIWKGFMIQTGSPDNRGKGWDFSIPAELGGPKHVRGVLSMARKTPLDSANGGFFITHADKPGLDGRYASFGKLVSGLEILDRIASVECGPSPLIQGETTHPKFRIELRTVDVK